MPKQQLGVGFRHSTLQLRFGNCLGLHHTVGAKLTTSVNLFKAQVTGKEASVPWGGHTMGNGDD